MTTPPTAAIDRLSSRYYNEDAYDAVENPGGLDESDDGLTAGHVTNFPSALVDVGDVAEYVGGVALAVSASQTAVATDREAVATDRAAVHDDRLAADISALAAMGGATTATNKASDAAASATLADQYAVAAGGAVPSVRLTWDTATADADPGNGKLRANNATLTAATALYVDNLDAGGVSITAVLDRWTDSTNTVKGTLRIAHRTNNTKWVEYQVTGTVVNGTGYRKITVANGIASGSFAAGDPVAIGFSRAGDMPSSFATGSAAAPGWAVTGDPDTGLAQVGGVNTLSLVAGGVESLRAVSTPSTVNYITVSGAVTGDHPYFIPMGPDPNIGLTIKTKGSGSFLVRGPDHALQFIITPVPSAANYVRTIAGATGISPTVTVGGSDPNASLVLASQGSGAVGIRTGGDQGPFQMVVQHTSGATRYPVITGSASGNSSISTNAGDLNLTSATGVVRVNGAALNPNGGGGALWCGVATGTANALTLTPTTALTAYADGVTVAFITGMAENTSATTVAVSGLSAVLLLSVSGYVLNRGELKPNSLYQATYYGGSFRLQISVPSSIITNGLVSRLDVADSACYSTGQTLANLAATPADGSSSATYSWVRGSSTSAASDDPTFNGTPGGLSASEYFSVDGGDFFSLAAASNTAFIDSLHKSGAVGTIAVWLLLAGDTPIFSTGDSNAKPYFFFRVNPASNYLMFVQGSSAGGATIAQSSSSPATGAWAFVAVSFAEGVTNGSFFYSNGNYSQVSSANTFTLTYTSPTATTAGRKAAFLDYGVSSGFAAASGTRLAQALIWNRALTKAELDATFNATRSRYGV